MVLRAEELGEEGGERAQLTCNLVFGVFSGMWETSTKPCLNYWSSGFRRKLTRCVVESSYFCETCEGLSWIHNVYF